MASVLVAKHLRALFEKLEFVEDLRHAAKHGGNADFLIRRDEVGEDNSISVLVTCRNIFPVLDALGVGLADGAVSSETIEHICRWYGDEDLELQFGQTTIFSGRLSGPQMALSYRRPFPAAKEMLELIPMDNYRRF